MARNYNVIGNLHTGTIMNNAFFELAKDSNTSPRIVLHPYLSRSTRITFDMVLYCSMNSRGPTSYTGYVESELMELHNIIAIMLGEMRNELKF